MNNETNTVEGLMSKILEIDKQAAQKLQDAQKTQTNLKNQIKTKQSEIEKKYEEILLEKFADFKKENNEKIEIQEKEIKEKLSLEKKALEQKFSSKKQALIDDLYNAVLGGDSN